MVILDVTRACDAPGTVFEVVPGARASDRKGTVV